MDGRLGLASTPHHTHRICPAGAVYRHQSSRVSLRLFPHDPAKKLLVLSAI
jgi:hypothetical protein